ncbi:glycosyltransferase WbsX family protein (plasmid) [Segnochrobactraceae bacterium EtOH-i3]
MLKNTELKSVAFYLPQFHPTSLNDSLWGPGFSEWRNVVRARPLFEGHFQPKMPGKMGFYDLRSADVLQDQADLARQFGIDAFCFYYYRFGSQRALDRPIEIFLENSQIDVGFFYCWANESWTRAWDGKSDDVMLAQSYGDEAFSGLLADLLVAMRDPRYFRISGRPVFMIYQLDQIPEASEFVRKLRRDLKAGLGEEVTIGCTFSPRFSASMLEYIDFVVQFPPHRLPRPPGKRILISPEKVQPFDPSRDDYFEGYDDVLEASLNPENWPDKLYLGVTPDWDNSARRPRNAHIIVGSTPDKFQAWVGKAAAITRERFTSGLIEEPILFVNAWNEWAEGAILEPSELYGDAYARAFLEGIRARFPSAG